ncbi:MAG TPA: kynureninase [Pirellulaceae bacterium]
MGRGNWQAVRDAAVERDARDPLREFRAQFHIPPGPDGSPESYLVGHSLGLQPRRTADFIADELATWRACGARGHHEGIRPWMPYHELLAEPMTEILGTLPTEVVSMNSLTTNLHLMMVTFYRPTAQRHRILIEEHAFPSDQYAVASQIAWHGFSPESSLIIARPREHEHLLREEDICDLIRKHRDSLALVLLPGVQYYTGQWLDPSSIVDTAHRNDIVVGLDVAHAAGNVPLTLHHHHIDFAVWCTYKYLNSGPGSVGGCFIHESHAHQTSLPRFAGWWGHDQASRFRMGDTFQPIPTAEGWQLSNPPILSLAAIRASLEVFREAGGITPLRVKSVALTGFLEQLLLEHLSERVTILTPSSPDARGCQLSLEVQSPHMPGRQLQQELQSLGIMTDWREPNVLRAAPVPLYNSFEDCARLVESLSTLVQ